MDGLIATNIIKNHLLNGRTKPEIKTLPFFNGLDPHEFEGYYAQAYKQSHSLKSKFTRNKPSKYPHHIGFRISEVECKNFNKLIYSDVTFNTAKKNTSSNYRRIFISGIHEGLRRLGLKPEIEENNEE